MTLPAVSPMDLEMDPTVRSGIEVPPNDPGNLGDVLMEEFFDSNPDIEA